MTYIWWFLGFFALIQVGIAYQTWQIVKHCDAEVAKYKVEAYDANSELAALKRAASKTVEIT